MSSYGGVQGSIFHRFLNSKRLHLLRAPFLRQNKLFLAMRETRRTWSNLRERSSSTKFFLQSLTRARVREKQEDPPHLERSVFKICILHLQSRTERTPKAKIKSCPFWILMIETSFTLFLLKKTTQKIAIFGKTFFQKKSMNSYFFSWGTPRSRPDLAYLTEICEENAF